MKAIPEFIKRISLVDASDFLEKKFLNEWNLDAYLAKRKAKKQEELMMSISTRELANKFYTIHERVQHHMPKMIPPPEEHLALPHSFTSVEEEKAKVEDSPTPAVPPPNSKLSAVKEKLVDVKDSAVSGVVSTGKAIASSASWVGSKLKFWKK